MPDTDKLRHAQVHVNEALNRLYVSADTIAASALGQDVEAVQAEAKAVALSELHKAMALIEQA